MVRKNQWLVLVNCINSSWCILWWLYALHVKSGINELLLFRKQVFSLWKLRFGLWPCKWLCPDLIGVAYRGYGQDKDIHSEGACPRWQNFWKNHELFMPWSTLWIMLPTVPICLILSLSVPRLHTRGWKRMMMQGNISSSWSTLSATAIAEASITTIWRYCICGVLLTDVLYGKKSGLIVFIFFLISSWKSSALY